MVGYYYLIFCVSAASAFFWKTPDVPKSSETTCPCGWLNQGRIVGGEESGENRYPLVAAVENGLTGELICGGSIITEWHVLTAAHCRESDDITFKVRIGAHDIRNSGKVYDVERFVPHEYYSEKYIVNDIALLVTAKKMEFNQRVGPVCLPSKRLLFLTGEKITAIGWGTIWKDGPASPVLRQVELEVISFQDCKAAYAGTRLGPTKNNVICTFNKGKDTCQGDSGGPLIWRDPETGRLTLVGVVSYGKECGGIYPGVNTDVSALLSWINKSVTATKPGVKVCTKA